jgi:hypothetical protein
LIYQIEPLRKCVDDLSAAKDEDPDNAAAAATAETEDEELLHSVTTVLQCIRKPTQDIIDLYQTTDSDLTREQLLKVLRIRAKDVVASEFVSKRRKSLDSKSKPVEVLDDLADAFKKQTDRVRNLFK